MFLGSSHTSSQGVWKPRVLWIHIKCGIHLLEKPEKNLEVCHRRSNRRRKILKIIHEMDIMMDKYPPKTNMTMENPPCEDVFTIENGDFPMSC